MIHTLKTWPQYFETVQTGQKMFEFRKADRQFKTGDILVLQEWDPDKKEYSGRECYREVTYIFTEGFGLPEGFCIMSLIVKNGY